VPGLIVAYLSIHVVFALAPFALPTRRKLRALMGTLAVVIGVAAVGFLLLPADLAFPPATGLGIWERPFRLADRLNGDHNLVPSLHVALSVTCLAAYARNASRVGAGLLWGWAGLIAISTVLTQQHHVLDAVTGFALGLAGHGLMRAREASGGAPRAAGPQPRDARRRAF
jgi:membrane-associated phospholipid phosphatase